MKLLLIHSDFLEFEARKPALRNAPQLKPGEDKGRAEEALVVFYSVEKMDEDAADNVVRQAVGQIKEVTGQVRTDNVVLYPYAHLSHDLAAPKQAIKIGEKLIEATKAEGYQVTTAPFGWYKAFNIKAKGHPLSELSRSIVPQAAEDSEFTEDHPSIAEGSPSESRESEALKKEQGLRSKWYVLTPEGELTEASEFDFSGHDELKALYKHETEGTRAAGQEPPHVRLMRDLELVDYEPGSDPGNFRWYPKGHLVKRLLEDQVSNLVHEAGGMRVETPIMYDYEHPALSKYLHRFPARQYILKSEDKDYFLRFAACFGQYLIMHDATISYKHLPLRVYELTHYSFRREQTGELSGLRRLRSFTMPDMHTLAADMEQAKEEFFRQYKSSMQWMRDLDVPYEAAVRFVRSFFDENRDFAKQLAQEIDRPLLIEMWDERFFYFIMKFEFNVVDSQGKASALSTVQIDVENTERFDIKYTTSGGERKHPLLLHASLSGSIDRNMYALLETQARRMNRGEKAALPFWLAPTQIRFIPVNDTFAEKCLEMAAELNRHGLRADVDDREEGVGRKIRDAGKEWVPATVVYGEKEAEAGTLPVRLRSGEQLDLDFDGLRHWAMGERGNRATAPLPVPVRLSLRPVFRG